MTYVAFLRAINVGGHTVTMATLRDLFSALGFSGVETFIASGNVIFESRSRSGRLMERQIEERLESALGYKVATFVRTTEEVREIGAYKPFSDAVMRDAQALNIGFLAAPLSASAVDALMTLKTEIDDFHVHGREVYWLCRRRQNESKFSNKVFERVVKVSTTFRSASTITKLAATALDVRGS